MTVPISSSSRCLDTENIAAEGITSSVGPTFQPTLERTWWKFDIFILPILVISSLLATLDQANLGNARIAGLQDDLKMTNSQFSLMATITAIPLVLAGFASNLVLKTVGPNVLLPTMMVVFGIATTLQGVIKSYSSVLVCRFFIGLFEGSFSSGIILYLSFWYPRQQLQRRISVLTTIVSFTQAISGFLAFYIIRMDGIANRPGWAWIFILEGLFTIFFGIFAVSLIPCSPNHFCLLNQKEKEYIIIQLRESGATSHDEDADSFSWHEIVQAVRLPHVWMLISLFFFEGTILYALGLFTPSIVVDLGYSNMYAQLYSALPIVVAFPVTFITTYLSDFFGARGFIIMFTMVLAMIGFAIFLCSESNHIKYGAIFFMNLGASSAGPALWAWITNNTAPHTRRATATALCSCAFTSGGILGIWLLGTLSHPPLYAGAIITLLIFSIFMVVLAATNTVYLAAQNRKKAKIRATSSRENEKSGLGDRSAWFTYKL